MRACGNEAIAKNRSESLAVPSPRQGERPTSHADRVGEWCVSLKSEHQRKTHGLFLTPVQVADLMAARLKTHGGRLRLLDPAAGAGVLCCAAVESLAVRSPKPTVIDLVAYEVDNELISPLRSVLDNLKSWSNFHGVDLNYQIENSDFILKIAESQGTGALVPRVQEDLYDAVISNPPYFKIAKDDPRAQAVSDVIHGQPNIYGLFMAVSASLLHQQGDLVFITPRSFASGPYFKRFRAVFFGIIRPTSIHIFHSRRDAFRRDDVLQENIVFTGVRDDSWRYCGADARIGISSSTGISDIKQCSYHSISLRRAIDLDSTEKVLRIPACRESDRVLDLVDMWPTSLRKLGLEISTGPVVPFRTTDYIAKNGRVPQYHAPLLWMNHVRAMKATWPLDLRKPEYIHIHGAKRLLVPNRNYVLVRRFSAKEEPRRLTAAPYFAAQLATSEIGLENHLNYIHRPAGTLLEDEAWGLAALYNSQLLDTWFRAVNGNTQVSATELRSMPLPSHDAILMIGKSVKCLADPLAGLDSLVTRIAGFSKSMEGENG